MTAHARLSASSAERWLNCTGSPALNEGKVSHTSVWAQEGTDAHKMGEEILRGASVIPTTPEGDEMLEAVSVYTTYCLKLMDEADEYHIEKQITLNNLYWDSKPPEPLFGTADFVAKIDKVLHVVDYKHGAGVVVEVANNAQLAYYALGAFFAMTNGNPKSIDEVEITIIQPRAPHPLGPVRTWYIGVADLMLWGKKFKNTIDKIANGETLLNTGTWCRFCPSQGDCPEAYREAVESARLDFKAAPSDGPETLTDEALVEVLNGMHFAESWLKAVATGAQGRLERGNTLDGWKLVAKRAIRKWKDEPSTVLWVEASLSQNERPLAFSNKILSPAQMEKILKKLGKSLPVNLIEKKSSGVTLASEADPREATPAGPLVDFDNLPDQSH